MRKGQSLLVSAVIHLVSILLFFVVIVALLTSYYHVRFVVNDFDQTTESLIVVKRLISSSDCFAMDKKNISFGPLANSYFGERVYPGVLDINKLTSFYHVNCMRKDSYDLLQDLRNGVISPVNGTGAAAKWDIAPVIYNPSTKSAEWLYSYDSETGIISHTATSVIGRINKEIRRCEALADRESDPDYCYPKGDAGKDVCTGGSVLNSRFGYTNLFESCHIYNGGDCIHDTSAVRKLCSTTTGIRPLWKVNGYTFGKTFDLSISTDKNGNPTASSSVWTQRDLTCGENGVRYYIPFYYIDNSGDEHAGLMLVSYCDVKGDHYVGLSLPEIIYKVRYNK